jgi:hypothetical protein
LYYAILESCGDGDQPRKMRGPQSNAARSGEVPIIVEDVARFDEIAAGRR